MCRPLVRGSRRLAGTFALLTSLSAAVAGQSAVVTGRVTSEGTPIGGASVSIPELAATVVTSADGRYTLTVDAANTRGRTITVLARSIGFKPTRRQLEFADGRIAADFDLVRDVLNLEQIVVTGVSDATASRMLPFAVAVVDASLLKDAPGTSPIASLSGKVAGASVITVSGQPGSAPAMRLRAPVSISGGSDPLVIVDGTITRHSLADIASEDVERIEVIKGAAASSLYGSDAANGVVQIFTRRGKSLADGETAVALRSEYGRNSLSRRVPRNESHAYVLGPGGEFVRDGRGNRIPETDGISDNPYPQTYDQLSQVFKPGQFMTNYLSVGQRRIATNFAASFQHTRETGVLAILSGFSRQNLRLNLDQSLSDKWTVSTGAFYSRSTADQGEDTGAFSALQGLEPNVNLRATNKDGTPYDAAIRQPPQAAGVFNPLYVLSRRQIVQGRDRFTGHVVARYQPMPWLAAEGNFNYDVANQNYKALEPAGFLNSSGVAGKGSLLQQTRSEGPPVLHPGLGIQSGRG